jgi:hypothetical protein
LASYNSDVASNAASLQELRQHSCSQAVRLISCSSLLVQLGAGQLTQALQETLVAAVDAELLQPFAEGAVSAASPLQPAAAAGLLADAGCALAAAECSVPECWLARYAAVAGVLLPVASGDSCCRLSAAVCGLGCQLSPAWLRELQRQVSREWHSWAARPVDLRCLLTCAVVSVPQHTAETLHLVTGTWFCTSVYESALDPGLPAGRL